jgi:hypothetical protein
VPPLTCDRRPPCARTIAELTDERMVGMTEPGTEPGYPEPESFAIRECLQVILIVEWEHRLYAERDFDLPGSRSP